MPAKAKFVWETLRLTPGLDQTRFPAEGRLLMHVKSNAVAGRTFVALAEVNQFLLHWEKTVADVRIHGTTKRQVAELFHREKPSLRPLP